MIVVQQNFEEIDDFLTELIKEEESSYFWSQVLPYVKLLYSFEVLEAHLQKKNQFQLGCSL